MYSSNICKSSVDCPREIIEHSDSNFILKFLLNTMCKRVSMRCLDLYQYKFEKVYVRIDRVKGPIIISRNVETRNSLELSKYMHKKGYEYSKVWVPCCFRQMSFLEVGK